MEAHGNLRKVTEGYGSKIRIFHFPT